MTYFIHQNNDNQGWSIISMGSDIESMPKEHRWKLHLFNMNDDLLQIEDGNIMYSVER